MKTNSRSFGAKIWLATAAIFVLLLLAGTAFAQWTGPDGNNNIYYNSGKVGIGTASPFATLDVKTATDKELLVRQATDFGGLATAVALHAINTAHNAGVPLSIESTLLTLNAATGGNVGIGTTGPNDTLHVGGSGNFGIQIGNTWGVGIKSIFVGGIGSRMDFVEYANSDTATTRMSILSGNVGIGTTTPGQKLQVVGGQFGAFNSGSTGGATIDGNAQTGTTSIFSDYLGGAEPKLHLSTYSGRATAAGITVDTSGKVGIGNNSPTVRLDVAGDIKVSGNINAKYQDVAEWVPSSEQMPAGTVVVLDTIKSNQVISSTQAYDTRVAGVISEQPGITLGEGGEGKVLVATTGRVLVRVDATNSPIHIGDLLVTSDVPGLAMKSEPIKLGGRLMHMPGTLIGKALEPLEKGSGKILVLLSLQ